MENSTPTPAPKPPVVPAPPSSSFTDFFRNTLAQIVIIVAVVGIIASAYFYITKGDKEAPERVFTAILPLLATWVGTVLAFYFGRENFEAASNRYEQIIQKLTPEILDDVAVGQIMISRKTMVCLDLEVARKKGVKKLIEFLNDVDKSRLPVLENRQLKYIIHKSLFLDALHKTEKEDISFEDFVKAHESMITTVLKVEADTVLEKVMAELKANKEVRDVFIIDKDEKVQGWLTDTQIVRYTKTRLQI